MSKITKWNAKNRTHKFTATEDQIKELRKLFDEVIVEAKKVVKDYKENPPVSGSDMTVVQIHQDSPILKEKKKSINKILYSACKEKCEKPTEENK